ncbi:MAG: hypothetical protein J7621_01520 [Niastella sp.]|nr:hypothetical protein [Niastella sp.]
MNYPQELLPQTDYKLIDCNVENCFLLRLVDDAIQEEMINPETGYIRVNLICSPRERIYDLSVILLGVYTQNHIPIELTREGKTKFGGYCEPNSTISDPPVYNDHFVLNKNKRFWVSKISSISNIEVPYSRDNSNHTVRCYVKHTPTKWNFWHYSLRWESSEGNLDDMDEKKRGKVLQRMANEARVMLSRMANVEYPQIEALPASCYQKKSPVAA